MVNIERYSFMENVDKLQIVDSTAELQDILDCGGVMLLDIKNPDKENVYVLYIDTGSLKISKVKV